MTRRPTIPVALRAVGVASSAGAVLLAACILAPQSASANPGAATAAAPSQTIRWSACPKAEPPYPDPSKRAECGTVKVPVDWAKPDGRKREIAVARQKATDPEQRVGALFSNPGGPGNAGLDDAYHADNPVEGYSKSIRARFDIIGFDPRGIGRSGQLRCDDALAERIPTRPRNAVGQRYARLFPDRLRALALDGAMDPSRPDARRFLRDGAAAS
ncbi:hypothetical protein [Streptomyces sioyaensis]|uniref:hypothetical protein n=1 Tax=Streptomyces sioyaensis TaxID=67364 RepID=UPI0037A31846